MSPGRALNSTATSQLLQIVASLGSQATFRRIWMEAQRRGVLSWHRTVRRYLDLLVAAGALNMRRIRTKAPLPTEVYTVTGREPRAFAGLRCLQEYGLAWEGPANLHPIPVEFEGVVRGRLRRLQGRLVLVASLEDCLLFELNRDAEQQTGYTELVAALLATKSIDLPYLLRRADQQSLGKALRLLFKRLVELLGSKPRVEDWVTFMAVREAFLRILRNYASHGADRLVELGGRGRKAVEVVEALSDESIVATAGKQLGVRG